MHKGINTTVDEGQTPVVVNALTATGVGTCGADDNQAQAGHLLPMAFDTAQITSAANGTRVSPELPASTLAKVRRMHVAIGFNWQNGGGYGNANDGLGITAEGTGPLQRSQHPAVAAAMRVRRLTPTECERLQGFPDGWTQVPYRNKPAADGPRYKAIGNSMAVPVMAWIGQRIAEVNSIISLKEAA